MEAEVGEVETFENVEQTDNDENLEMQNNHHLPETSEELSQRLDPLHECS